MKSPLGVSNPGGIGRSLVHAFLHAGYAVGAIDIAPIADEDSTLSAAIQTRAFEFRCTDVSKEAGASDAVQSILQSLSRSSVDVLVNNAALANPVLEGECLQERMAAWRRFMDVNLTGPFVMSEVVAPHMAAGAAIIHIASTRAHQSEPRTEGYAASKSGLCGLTHCQAVTLGSRGIRVNCILPGWIDTGGYPITEADAAFHCAGRVGVPADIANMAVYLADPSLSGFITGQEFVVDGGVSKKMIYPA